MNTIKINVPKWWYILPSYLTLWTVFFSFYALIDGNGMMQAFGINTGGGSDFIMLNSAGRYVALGIAMILGIWVLRTYHTIITVLIARLVMDIIDLSAGIKTDIIEDINGVLQSFLMFLLPNIITIVLLLRFNQKYTIANI